VLKDGEDGDGDVLPVNEVQARLALHLIFGLAHLVDPVSGMSLSAPETGEVEDAPAQGEEFVFGDSTRFGGVIRRVTVDPEGLVGDLVDSRRA